MVDAIESGAERITDEAAEAWQPALGHEQGRLRLNVMRPRSTPLCRSFYRRCAMNCSPPGSAAMQPSTESATHACCDTANLDALSPRSLDLSLTRNDQNRLAEFFRCDPWSIPQNDSLPK